MTSVISHVFDLTPHGEEIMKKLLIIFSVLFLAASSLHAASKDPVGVLFQPKGKVEYTKKGKKWRKIRRNKFLFRDYQVRTGPDSSGKITVQATGESHLIGPNSLILVTKKGLEAKEGSISEVASSGTLLSGLMKKFSRSQSYTTVRRSHKKKKLKIETASQLTLTDEHPFMVWENIGSDLKYRLSIDGKVYEVPATKEKMVRVKVGRFNGAKPYEIEGVKDGKTVVTLKPRKVRGKLKVHTAKWLNGDEKTEYEKNLNAIQETYGEASFMLGGFYERQNMWVAAMELYKQYLAENPDEIEMTPYLFRVYKKLRLNDIYKKELTKWKLELQG